MLGVPVSELQDFVVGGGRIFLANDAFGYAVDLVNALADVSLALSGKNCSATSTLDLDPSVRTSFPMP